MTYRYLNIRFDSNYSLDVETDKVIDFIKTIEGVKQADKVQFENEEKYPWGVLSLVKCDNRGCFSIGKGEYFDKVNLIELIFSDTEESFEHYCELGSKFAKEMNWEMFDEDTDQLLVEKW